MKDKNSALNSEKKKHTEEPQFSYIGLQVYQHQTLASQSVKLVRSLNKPQ